MQWIVSAEPRSLKLTVLCVEDFLLTEAYAYNKQSPVAQGQHCSLDGTNKAGLNDLITKYNMRNQYYF